MPQEDWQAGEYRVPKKKYVFTSPYTMHRHPDYYEHPELFLPGRWTPEAIEKRPRYAYFPFGVGPRACIGEQFAWTEMILVVATLAQGWRFHLAPSQEIATDPSVTLRPKGGIRMILERRESAEAGGSTIR